jgi:mono/diheme cytochrome c family protein
MGLDRFLKTLVVLSGFLALTLSGPSSAQTAAASAPAAAAAEEPVPKFDPAYMRNPANIKVGQTVWTTQCMHCHGAKAYPGKAPKLNPGTMDADYIFDRVTYGFKGMPPWKAVFSLEERKGVVAWIKSDGFAP